MRIVSRTSLGALIAVAAMASTAVQAKDLPDFDALSLQPRRAAVPLRAAERALVAPGAPMHRDDRLDLPTFVWAVRRSGAPAGSHAAGTPQEEQAARSHLGAFASLYRLTADDVRSAVVSSVHDTGAGAVVVAFQQKVEGIEIFRDEIRIAMDQQLDLIALAGYIAALPAPGARRAFAQGAAEAVAGALRDYLGPDALPVGEGDLSKRHDALPGGYTAYDLTAGAARALNLRFSEVARAKPVYFHLPDALEPAFYVEISPGSASSLDADAYGYVISAVDGRLLFRKNLTASDAFSYRVWADASSPNIPLDGPQGEAGTPHPTGLADGYQAPFTAPALVTLQNGPISTNDPWLAPGSTVTTGNNVDAYVDIVSPDGFTNSSDFRASVTSPGAFDRTYDTSQPAGSQTQRMASITQLFYNVNFLHDWFYDAGFDEASRNAQTNNFGRGGLQNDSIRAEAQDYSGRDNANMSTPADGSRPRMQMFVWNGIGHRALTVTAPAGIAGDYAVGTALFGPAVFSTPDDVALVDDGAAPGSDGCTTPFANAGAVAGRIAFIDRGTCAFTVKVKNAQLNGAVGVIIANNADTGIFTMSGTDATITIPSLFITKTDGDLIRPQLGPGVSATLLREAALERDGTIDNQIVAHEWGHYISNRLVGNSSGLSNSQGGSMGEGWGDFHAMLMTVRPQDALVASNADWAGAYALATYVSSGGSNGPLPNTGYYFGIRRYPYSSDMGKNPLTLRHIADGVPLPAGPPVLFGASGVGSAEVHNAGEVWAAMLWECFTGLLRDTLGVSPRLTFDEARDRMRGYLVAAYKMTPNAPTFLEARDAVLAAALSGDPDDYVVFLKAFAKRGAGAEAVAPDRSSSGHQDAVESFQPDVDLVLTGAALTDASYSCDQDAALDNTETGELTITLRNTGSVPYGATTATFTSGNPDVSFPGGGTIAVPAIGASGTASASIPVSLAGAAGVQPIDIDIAWDDPDFQVPGPRHMSFSWRGNADDLAGQSAGDDVESDSPQWTVAGNGSLSTLGPWRRREIVATDHVWHGPDPRATSDQWLVSPLLNVAPAGSFSFTFRHRYYFEAQTTPSVVNYDGGVIEVSNNGGASWIDVANYTAPGYNGTLVSSGTNPLAGRNAFVQVSAGWPGFITTTINLGSTFQGQNIRVRFRIGTDVSGDDPGWDIDDIVFAGITNAPFHVVVPDQALCVDGDMDGTADRDDCAPADGGLWTSPGEALNLDVGPAGALSWEGPTQPGGAAVLYDVIRSDAASSFAAATCLESGIPTPGSSDPASPASIFYYLVRSKNGCGANLGTDSLGAIRTGVDCP